MNREVRIRIGWDNLDGIDPLIGEAKGPGQENFVMQFYEDGKTCHAFIKDDTKNMDEIARLWLMGEPIEVCKKLLNL